VFLIPARAIFGTKDCVAGTRRKGASNWDPRPAGFATDQLLWLLASRTAPIRAHLLKVTECLEKLLHNSEVGTLPPVQQDKQQGNEDNNNQVFQIAFSAIMNRITMFERRD
jgi:hypothetical protein